MDITPLSMFMVRNESKTLCDLRENFDHEVFVKTFLRIGREGIRKEMEWSTLDSVFVY